MIFRRYNHLMRTAMLLLSVLLLQNMLNAEDLKVLKERTFATSPGKELTLETATGDIYVSVWDKQEVYVKISGNRKAAEKLQYKFNSSSSGVNIVVKKESGFQWLNFGSGMYVKFEVKIPRQYNTSFRTAGGDVKIYNQEGIAKISTSGGDITLINTKCETHSSTSGGDINVDNNKGSLSLSTSGGDINVTGFDGNLSASTSGGDIKLKGKSGRVSASTSGGDIFLEYDNSSNYGIDLGTTGGDIKVVLPADFKANAELGTTGGDIECDHMITRTRKISHSRFDADLNGGGNKLDCHTTGGDIKILKKNGAN